MLNVNLVRLLFTSALMMFDFELRLLIFISVATESSSVTVRKRCINENTSVPFMKAISLTPSISADSIDLLLDSFNSKVKNVIDGIAPVMVSK